MTRHQSLTGWQDSVAHFMRLETAEAIFVCVCFPVGFCSVEPQEQWFLMGFGGVFLGTKTWSW